MEDVLAVYTRPRDPDRPLVCLDETSKQLLAETRATMPMKPGRPARCDYEYERNGTANLFMLFAPLEGWRRVKVTDRHTAVDYAHVLKDLPRSPHPRETHPRRGSRRLGARPQRQSRQGQLALHNPKRSHQTQAPIPFNLTESSD